MREPVKKKRVVTKRTGSQSSKPASGPETVTPPHGDPFAPQLESRKSEPGRKGGSPGGGKGMDVSARQQREIAMKAAKLRWAKRHSS